MTLERTVASSALSCAPDGVIYEEGFPADRDVIDEAAFARAVQAAKEADAAVIFAGLPDSFESEGYDRQHMRLPDCQNELIRHVDAIPELRTERLTLSALEEILR